MLIFPEGTRRAPGDPPDYKPGVAALYDALRLPVVPVALNSGLFWRRRSSSSIPGRIVVEFLEPIPPGLDRKAFMQELEQRDRDRHRPAGGRGLGRSGPTRGLDSPGDAAISPPPDAQVAQLVEQRTENPRVGGSNPPLGKLRFGRVNNWARCS